MSEVIKIIFSEEFLATIIRVGVPLMFAAMSAYIAAESGLHNIAVEGIMLMSALMAVLGSYWTQSAFWGLLISVATGVIMALLLAFMTIRFGCDDFLVGIAINTFASSFSIFLLYIFTGNKGMSASLGSKTLPVINIPIVEKIPILGAVLSGHYFLTYVCYGCIIIVGIMMYKTSFGLCLKATGLNSDAAKSVGVNVNRMRIIAIVLSGIFASFGGAYMTMGYLSAFSRDMIAGRGWIGFAAQAMGGGDFLGVGLTTLIFSFFQAIVTAFSRKDLPSELMTTIPYIGVFAGIVIFSMISYHKKRESTKK